MSLLSFQCTHRFPGGFEFDIAFEMNHTIMSLFGPSGSGKTSVLSTIAGFLRPASGKVQLGDDVVLDTANNVCLPPERRHLGMVFQDHLLFPHLTVEKNLRYGQRRRQRQGRKIERSRVVDVLEIGPLLQRYPRNLSGGEQQRVALGRALLSGPQLLLMDEPMASLDAPLKVRILDYLQRIADEWKLPILFVSHSQAEVRRVADWVVILKEGRVVAGGTPDDALSRPEPLGWKNAIGPANLLRLERFAADGDHVTAQIGEQTLYLPLESVPKASPLFVQFSPADVTLSRHDVPGISTRNHLRGRVCQMVKVDRAVFVAVDIGQILWAEVTPEAAAELELTLGSEVTCLLKALSLQVVN